MRCRKVRGDFTGYLDHSLDAATAARMKEHLAHCRECGAELRFFKAYLEKTVGLPREKAPEDLMRHVRQRLDASDADKGLRQRPLWRQAVWLPRMTGLAAGLVMLLLVLGIQQRVMDPLRQAVPEKAAAGITARTGGAPAAQAPPVTALRKEESAPAPLARQGSFREQAAAKTNATDGTGHTALPDVPEYSPGPQPLGKEPVAAPPLAYSTIPRAVAVKLIIESESDTADKAPLAKMQETAERTAQTVKSEKPGAPDQPSLKKTTAPDLAAFLEKYQGRAIQNTRPQIWGFKIPGQEYQQFLNDVAKLGRIEETSKNPATQDRVSGEVELRLKLGLESSITESSGDQKR